MQSSIEMTGRDLIMLDLTAEDKYYYWLMTSIGLDEELVGYIRDCVESDEEVSEYSMELIINHLKV